MSASLLHNPIRVLSVDEVPVDWTEKPSIALTPEVIRIPWPEVLRVADECAASSWLA
ncbi:hypothetical protein [Kitasatospora cineracea]|uniref:hypothetical protein n=1 Tax=Kitasatospora cineracea TaxID=88074 RepID=UPI0038052141